MRTSRRIATRDGEAKSASPWTKGDRERVALLFVFTSRPYCQELDAPTWPPNGLELSCPAAQATLEPFSRILAGKAPSNFPHASRVSSSESLSENPEFANSVPTSTPRAWGAHADRPHFLRPSMPFLGLAPQRPEFSHSLASG